MHRQNLCAKFEFVIGNSPYQDESVGDNKTFKPPIYNEFLDAAYKVADCVEMMHPARFLFNAGNTPKQWNRQMLEDPDLKILFYEQNSSRVFSNTEIKGGVAISYHKKVVTLGVLGYLHHIRIEARHINPIYVNASLS